MYYGKYNCLPNPIIFENFVLINSNQTKYKICNNSENNFTINEMICEKRCVKSCNEIYYSITFDNYMFNGLTDSKVVIKHRISQEFHYISSNKYSILDYMSNIGGLIGLWFGIAFIDINIILKSILRRFKLFLYLTLNIDEIIENIKRYLNNQFWRKLLTNIKNIIQNIERYEWKRIIDRRAHV